MVAIPDPATFQLMPYTAGDRSKVARMICDVVTPDGTPYEGDPRYVLRRALDRMKSMGFDTFNVGPELEYFLFSSPDAVETLDDDLRAGIDTRRYEFTTEGSEPFTMLFLGSFRHTPNQEALAWFVNRACRMFLSDALKRAW